MRCKTMKEKWSEVLESVKRFFLITAIAIVGTIIFAIALTFAMTLHENKQLKKENSALKEVVEEYSKKEERNTTKYIIVKDEITDEVIYAYYK